MKIALLASAGPATHIPVNHLFSNGNDTIYLKTKTGAVVLRDGKGLIGVDDPKALVFYVGDFIPDGSLKYFLPITDLGTLEIIE